MSKKVIAISGSNEAYVKPYIEAIETLCSDFELTVYFPDSLIPENLKIDGLLLAGGGDVDDGPHYEEGCGEIDGVNTNRDRNEFYLLKQAIAYKLPILGICRGHQMINVFLGGKLFKDVECRGYSDHNGGVLHNITINLDSYIGKKFGNLNSLVNSYHHQAVSNLAPGLTSWATSDDMLNEAFASNDANIIGVQWHPERMLQDRLAISIFEHFLSRAGCVRSK